MGRTTFDVSLASEWGLAGYGKSRGAISVGPVPLSRGGTLFVFIVILAGPLVGLALTWPAERLGNWLIALTMAGSLAFGVVNHFVLDSADHVAHVQPEWRVLFAATAVLLALTELLGSGLAIGVLRARTSS
jgi:hypothetical protein